MTSTEKKLWNWWLIALLSIAVINMMGCVHAIPKGLTFSKDAESQVRFIFLFSEKAGVELGGCLQGRIDYQGVRVERIVFPTHYRASALDVEFRACGAFDLGFFHTHIVQELTVCQFSSMDLKILIDRPNPMAGVMCRIGDEVQFKVYLRKTVLEKLFPNREVLPDDTLTRPP